MTRCLLVEPENDLLTPAYVHGKLEKCQEMVSEKSSLTLTEVEDLIKIPSSGPTWSLGQGSSTRFKRPYGSCGTPIPMTRSMSRSHRHSERLPSNRPHTDRVLDSSSFSLAVPACSFWGCEFVGEPLDLYFEGVDPPSTTIRARVIVAAASHETATSSAI